MNFAKVCPISTATFIITILNVIVHVPAQFVQRAIIYDGKNGEGDYFNIATTYAPDLGIFGFDNRAQSACVTGIWFFYNHRNFNEDLDTAPSSNVEYIFGPAKDGSSFCFNFTTLDSAVTSARFGGIGPDYSASTLTFYEGTYFAGTEEYINSDKPNLMLSRRVKSILLTGTDAWTLYDQPFHAGTALCICPGPSSGPVHEAPPLFIYDIESQFNTAYTFAASVKRGCFANA